MRTQTTRVIAGVVNADGTIKTGIGFTSRKTATGTYTVAFPGQRLIAASASSGVVAFIAPISMTGDAMQLGITTSAGALVDNAFTFTATVTA